MTDRPLQRSRSIDARSSLVEYGGVVVLLGAVVVLGTALRRVLEHLARVPPTAEPVIGVASAFTGRILLSFVYAVLVLGALGVGYALARGRVDRLDRIDAPDLFTITGTIVAAVFVLAYVAIDPIQRSVAPIAVDLAGPVTMVAFALGYIQYRDVPIGVSMPDGDALASVFGVTLLAVLAGGAVLIGLGTVYTDVFESVFQSRIGPASVLHSVVITGILGGVGYALLYNAAIQGRLGLISGPAQAVAAVTVLFPVRAWASIELYSITVFRQGPMASIPFVGSNGRVIGAVVVGVAAAWLFARGIGTLQSRLDDTVTTVHAGVAAAMIVSVAFVLVGVVRGYSIVAVSRIVGIMAVAAAASIGYERTRSVWVPALAFGAYLLLVNSALTRPLLAAMY
ncbi:hypothetical protein HLRTI_000781 [Halorhabdus tiamatea SARL4B]|uniref:Conserved hypothetical membrane protein n=1 Tax=Halorhabdus tiamatea SARL4B TaxID=1033806 RepID=F7PP29_9EURY|nr:hypothetical protein [Halorhabdus tiamatea]ERJ07182.1 hypothetical protein HLRTI_000781 [Halorhabdus tiamatea SARL4B]CCQ32803.1 conserved hypothetical membrane protein [Halorhabdus tiamatea SARL4B]